MTVDNMTRSNQIMMMFLMLSGMSVASTEGTIEEKKNTWETETMAIISLRTSDSAPATKVAGRKSSDRPMARASEPRPGSGTPKIHSTG